MKLTDLKAYIDQILAVHGDIDVGVIEDAGGEVESSLLTIELLSVQTNDYDNRPDGIEGDTWLMFGMRE